MLRRDKRTESPATGMGIFHDVPISHASVDLSATLPSSMRVVPYTVGASPKILTSAGMLAMVAAVNTYISGLSAAAQASMFQVPGGWEVIIRPDHVKLPVAPGDGATVATSLAAVINTGANVQAAP